MKARIITTDKGILNTLKAQYAGLELEVYEDVKGLVNVIEDVLLIDMRDVVTASLPQPQGTLVLTVVCIAQDKEQAQQLDVIGHNYIMLDSYAQLAADLGKYLKTTNVANNVVTFFGAQPRCGTTMLAMTVAAELATAPRRVCCLSLTEKPGLEYVTIKSEGGMMHILPRLASAVLEHEELIAACCGQDNCFYLSGINSLADVPHYTIDDIKALIMMAANYFDLVVIDAGSGATRMSLAALSSSAINYLVTAPGANAARSFAQLREQVFPRVPEINAQNMRLVLNGFDRSNETNSPRNLVREYRLDDLTVIDKSAYGLQAEAEQVILGNIDVGSAYREDIASLLNNLASQLKLNISSSAKHRKRGFFSFIGRR